MYIRTFFFRQIFTLGGRGWYFRFGLLLRSGVIATGSRGEFAWIGKIQGLHGLGEPRPCSGIAPARGNSTLRFIPVGPVGVTTERECITHEGSHGVILAFVSWFPIYGGPWLRIFLCSGNLPRGFSMSCTHCAFREIWRIAGRFFPLLLLSIGRCNDLGPNFG